MKKTFMFLSVVVILTLTATLATAGSAVVLKGKIPFDFYIGNQLLEAGEYNFEMGRIGDSTTSCITVRAKNGMVVAFATSRSGVRDGRVPSQLSFKSEDGKYFLVSVESVGYKAELRKTKVTHQPVTAQMAANISPK